MTKRKHSCYREVGSDLFTLILIAIPFILFFVSAVVIGEQKYQEKAELIIEKTELIFGKNLFEEPYERLTCDELKYIYTHMEDLYYNSWDTKQKEIRDWVIIKDCNWN